MEGLTELDEVTPGRFRRTPSGRACNRVTGQQFCGPSRLRPRSRASIRFERHGRGPEARSRFGPSIGGSSRFQEIPIGSYPRSGGATKKLECPHSNSVQTGIHPLALTFAHPFNCVDRVLALKFPECFFTHRRCLPFPGCGLTSKRWLRA